MEQSSCRIHRRNPALRTAASVELATRLLGMSGLMRAVLADLTNETRETPKTGTETATGIEIGTGTEFVIAIGIETGIGVDMTTTTETTGIDEKTGRETSEMIGIKNEKETGIVVRMRTTKTGDATMIVIDPRRMSDGGTVTIMTTDIGVGIPAVSTVIPIATLERREIPGAHRTHQFQDHLSGRESMTSPSLRRTEPSEPLTCNQLLLLLHLGRRAKRRNSASSANGSRCGKGGGSSKSRRKREAQPLNHSKPILRSLRREEVKHAPTIRTEHC